MRILRVADVPGAPTGGMARMMRGSGDALVAMGHDVDYLFHEDLPQRVGQRLRRFSLPASLPGLIRRRMREGLVPDVVELHEPLAAPYCVERSLGRRLPPVVVLSHGLEERGRRAELEDRARRGLTTSLRRRLTPLSVVWQSMLAVRQADHVICLNAEDRNHLLHVGVPETRLTQIANGVEDSYFVAGAAVERGELRARSLLFVGTWLERKGTPTLVPAVARVLRAQPFARFTAAGCGVAEETLRAEFPEDVRARIDVIPRVLGEEALQAIYARHGILVLPSIFEGFPLVMLEAAAMGLALVTTPICGMADFVEDGRNGLLVPVGDAEALGDALAALLGARAKVEAFGDAARAKASLYDWRATARGLADAYATAAARGRR